MGEIIEILDRIIDLEDDFGDEDPEDLLVWVINRVINVKARLEDL